jgi:hypothetical protein
LGIAEHGAGPGVNSAWEQYKLETGKLLENAAERSLRNLHFRRVDMNLPPVKPNFDHAQTKFWPWAN